MKQKIKNIIGWIICKMGGVKYITLPQMGARVKIVNKNGNIFLGNHCSFSNDTNLFNVTSNSIITFCDDIRVAHHFQISCANNVIIKSHVNIGPFVFISDHNHAFEDVDIPIKDQGIRIKANESVIIDEGTWIGTKVSIIGNVKIGKHCVIGANSVVTKDIPDYCVAAGVPAKILKSYNFETKQWVKV